MKLNHIILPEHFVKIFFHRSDLDGVGSAAIFRATYPKEEFPNIEFIPADYADDQEELRAKVDGSEDLVIFVDVTLEPFELMKEMADTTDLIVIDHHDSFKRHVNKSTAAFKQVIYGDDAAIQLTWKALHDSPPPLTVTYLGLFDTWKHDYNPEILKFQAGARELLSGYKNKNWKKLFFGTEEVGTEIKAKIDLAGEVMERYFKRRSKSLCKYSTKVIEFMGYKKVLALNSELPGSIQVKPLTDKEDYDFVLIFSRRKDLWKYSIYRTSGNIDCSEIAEHFGGGGHEGAAGFQTEYLLEELQ